MKSILIAGCGYSGLALTRYAVEKGFQVVCLRRSEEAAAEIKAAGGEPFIADLSKPETLENLPATDYVVAMPAPSGEKRNYTETYLKSAENLVTALKRKVPRKFIWISSTSVYGQRSNEWVDETTNPNPITENGNTLWTAEGVVLGSGIPSIVLRLGGIYGPGRDRLKLLETGRVTTHDVGYMNHIHVEDIARLILFIIDKAEPGELYLGVDDQPVLRRELYEWLIEKSGIEVPDDLNGESGDTTTGSKRCSNRKIRDLGFGFKYPTYREGFAFVLAKK